MGVAVPLETVGVRSVLDKPHVYDKGNYVAQSNFEPQEFPKWMYKNGKSREVVSEGQELGLKAKGWSEQPPKEELEPAVNEDEE